MTKEIYVVKSNGTKELLDYDKIHKVVTDATTNIKNVSVSQIELAAQINIRDGITTKEIHENLIKAAANLISESTPNYQHVAANLSNYLLRKEVYGTFTPPKLLDIVTRNHSLGLYDDDILSYFSDSEWEQLDSFISHERDFNLTYIAIQQLKNKYLVQNRVNKKVYETPQVAYLLCSAVLFKDYPKTTRMRYIKQYYDAVSNFEISLPTPVQAGLRTKVKQFSSCVLVECDDNLDSINATATSIVRYASRKAGLGVNMGRLRGIDQPIRGGDSKHTGMIPFIKYMNGALKSCSQGGVRGASATVYYQWWHKEIESLIVLKNNRGTDETRVRTLDYGVQLNRLFYRRYLAKENVTLFSPEQVPELYEAFFADQEEFERLYTKYEKTPLIWKKSIPASELMASIIQERKSTGRIYIQNVDNVNNQGPFKANVAPVRQSNLCVAGNTLLETRINGKFKTIKIADMPDPVKNDVWVTGMDLSSENPVKAYYKVSAWAMTSPYAEVLRTTDINSGNSVDTTVDHRIWDENSHEYLRPIQLNDRSQLIVDCEFDYDMPYGVEVETLPDFIPVYDITVPYTSNFFANGILVHNCAEIDLPTKPLKYADDPEGEIALCTLSAINMGSISTFQRLEQVCDLAVRGLDALLSYQEYPIPAAANSTKKYRPLGVGVINFAHWLAKNNLKYGASSASKVDEWFQHFAYYLTKSSVELAKELGPCEAYTNTHYSDGVVPMDRRCVNVDELVAHTEYHDLDWNTLRSDLKTYGIRNATLMALMPSETSSTTSNATNGIEPPRSLIVDKGSKDGVMPQVVPSISTLKNKYELAWERTDLNDDYTVTVAIIQKYIDQGISINEYFNPANFTDGKVPASLLVRNLIKHYYYGTKQMYYCNTLDDDSSEEEAKPNAGPSAGGEDDCDGCKI